MRLLTDKELEKIRKSLKRKVKTMKFNKFSWSRKSVRTDLIDRFFYLEVYQGEVQLRIEDCCLRRVYEDINICPMAIYENVFVLVRPEDSFTTRNLYPGGDTVYSTYSLATERGEYRTRKAAIRKKILKPDDYISTRTLQYSPMSYDLWTFFHGFRTINPKNVTISLPEGDPYRYRFEKILKVSNNVMMYDIIRFLAFPEFESFLSWPEVNFTALMMNTEILDPVFRKCYQLGLRHKKIDPKYFFTCNMHTQRLWIDYIKDLITLEKDWRNPEILFPQDLVKEHGRLAIKVKLYTSQEEEKIYQKIIKDFLGKSMEIGGFLIKPLETIQEFYEEGQTLHHCVYSNSYWRNGHVILSVQKEGKHLETAEVEPRTGNIYQCRGHWNSPSEYHNEILEAIKEYWKKVKESA